MKSVMISIKTEWCEKIASGKKTIEVRKNRPKLETPFKCYIYETKAINHNKLIVDLDGDLPTVFAKGRGKVIGEFVCDRIDHLVNSGINKKELRFCLYNGDGTYSQLTNAYISKCRLNIEQIKNYSKGKDVYAWNITDLVIYDKPKELSEFIKYGFDDAVKLSRPPQSWCYVEEVSK